MKRRDPLGFDLTPLIDVVFILLIFFILTSTFKKNELNLSLTLPSSEYGENLNISEELNIELTESKIVFNGKVVDIDMMDKELANVINNKIAVFCRIDRAVRYDKIINLLDLFKKHRLENLVLVTGKD